MPLDPHRQANLQNWEDRVPIHVGPDGYAIEELVSEPQALSGVVAHDAHRLGDLTGLRAVHLQCHIGTDTLSLARLGAQVTGLDFSPSALAAARDLFTRTGTDGTFVEAELYDAPAALAGQRFDLVYTGVGALNWLPDIAAWAEVVAALLAPAGRLFLRESHPVLWSLEHGRDDDLLVVEHPYFQTIEPLRSDVPTTYAGSGGPIQHTTAYEWNHGIGEIITAVLAAGLRVDALIEHDELEYQGLPQMVRNDNGRYVLPQRRARLPLMYTLQATLPDTA